MRLQIHLQNPRHAHIKFSSRENFADLVAYCIKNMSFAKAGFAVNEKGIVIIVRMILIKLPARISETAIAALYAKRFEGPSIKVSKVKG